MSNNTKFYFSGENSPLGGLLSKILDFGHCYKQTMTASFALEGLGIVDTM